jgi:hypothetical protein
MSQEFKLKFDRMREGNPTGADTTDETQSGDNYPSNGNVRNLGFAWKDGKRTFLNYAYLVSAEYVPTENTILLEFTSHAVTLKGVRLHHLFGDLMTQMTKWIVCHDERYNQTEDGDTPIVNEIVVVRL